MPDRKLLAHAWGPVEENCLATLVFGSDSADERPWSGVRYATLRRILGPARLVSLALLYTKSSRDSTSSNNTPFLYLSREVKRNPGIAPLIADHTVMALAEERLMHVKRNLRPEQEEQEDVPRTSVWMIRALLEAMAELPNPHPGKDLMQCMSA